MVLLSMLCLLLSLLPPQPLHAHRHQLMPTDRTNRPPHPTALQCFVESARGKKDAWNGVLAGAASGAALGLRSELSWVNEPFMV